jgi:hypothetical protein
MSVTDTRRPQSPPEPPAAPASPSPEPEGDDRDRSVSFAELVHAHFVRQQELGGPHEAKAERYYRDRLKEFKREHGELVDAYWCRYEASGVALTEKERRSIRSLFRRDPIIRLHAATDWRTAHAPVVARMLHEWETVGIRVGEVLRGTSERIALQRVFAASCRLLGFLDRRRPEEPSGPVQREVERAHRRELAAVTDYYGRAAENQARIVYFQGMAWGAADLALAVGGVFLLAWAAGWIDPSHEPTQTFFLTIAMGAAGAILSVMTRMARPNGFNIDYEVGRKSARFLGGLRPWIGALFAVALYLSMKSGIVEVLTSIERTTYFYAAIAFLAGFSERWAKVLFDGVTGDGDEAEKEAKQPTAPPPADAIEELEDAPVGREAPTPDPD